MERSESEEVLPQGISQEEYLAHLAKAQKRIDEIFAEAFTKEPKESDE